MAEQQKFLQTYPELRQFLLSDVQLTGTKIGGGAYGIVEEVDIPVRAAAKTIHVILQGDFTASEAPKAVREFINECYILSHLRHPNIVQFLGLTFFPASRLPALVMERLLTSLHDLLDPEEHHSRVANSFFCLALRVSVLQNVACGLAYLHDRTPPVIHRDLSARNVLLDSAMVGKIADLGMARIMREKAAATMTKGPGALVYMPPEAFAPAKSNKDKSKYDVSIDVFSLGVVTIFTIGGAFPCNPLEHTYFDEKSGKLIARSELQRRSEYMSDMNDQLRVYGQCTEGHPLVRLVQQSLHNLPAWRPSIHEVQDLLQEARAGINDKEIERKKLELVQTLQSQSLRHQNLEHLIRDLVVENVIKDRELANSQQLLEEKEHQVQFTQKQLNDKEAELTRAEENIRKEQQQIQDKERVIVRLQQQLKSQSQQLDYTCQVDGPGLTSATVNHQTHIQLNITDRSGSPLFHTQKVSVLFESKATNTTTILPVTMTSLSMYEVSHTPLGRGQHLLYVQVNDRDIENSPFRVTVYPDPRQLGLSTKSLTGFVNPRAITFNSKGEMIVSENWGYRVSICNSRGEKIRTIGSKYDRPDQMLCPRGVTTDDANNMYVTSDHKLQKFASTGELIKSTGQMGSKKGEFDAPCGLTVYSNKLYVCDCDNNRIQVFDLDLNYVQSIGSHGKGKGEFDMPYDIKFDAVGNMYVPEWKNKRVQVLDSRGQFVSSFGMKGKGKLSWPTSLHIVDKYVYVSDRDRHCIFVYETSGQFITSFGRPGNNPGEFQHPYYIASCIDGFMYICDWSNNRVQIF